MVKYLKSVWLCHEHSLEHFGEIPEIECVVRLGGCGKELSHDGGVDLVSGTEKLWHQLICIFKTSQPG